MKPEEFKELSKQFVLDALNLMNGPKADLYAKNLDDRLASFKRGAELMRTTPEFVCLAYMTKHYVHLIDMVRDLEDDGFWRPGEEWVEVLRDLVNYSLLMYGLWVEGIQATAEMREKRENMPVEG